MCPWRTISNMIPEPPRGGVPLTGPVSGEIFTGPIKDEGKSVLSSLGCLLMTRHSANPAHAEECEGWGGGGCSSVLHLKLHMIPDSFTAQLRAAELLRGPDPLTAPNQSRTTEILSTAAHFHSRVEPNATLRPSDSITKVKVTQVRQKVRSRPGSSAPGQRLSPRMEWTAEGPP